MENSSFRPFALPRKCKRLQEREESKWWERYISDIARFSVLTEMSFSKSHGLIKYDLS